MKRIILSALLTSFIATFFYLAIWTSAMALSGKFLLTGIVCMIHFTFALMIYEFPNRIDYDIKQERKQK